MVSLLLEIPPGFEKLAFLSFFGVNSVLCAVNTPYYVSSCFPTIFYDVLLMFGAVNAVFHGLKVPTISAAMHGNTTAVQPSGGASVAK